MDSASLVHYSRLPSSPTFPSHLPSFSLSESSISTQSIQESKYFLCPSHSDKSIYFSNENKLIDNNNPTSSQIKIVLESLFDIDLERMLDLNFGDFFSLKELIQLSQLCKSMYKKIQKNFSSKKNYIERLERIIDTNFQNSLIQVFIRKFKEKILTLNNQINLTTEIYEFREQARRFFDQEGDIKLKINLKALSAVLKQLFSLYISEIGKVEKFTNNDELRAKKILSQMLKGDFSSTLSKKVRVARKLFNYKNGYCTNTATILMYSISFVINTISIIAGLALLSKYEEKNSSLNILGLCLLSFSSFGGFFLFACMFDSCINIYKRSINRNLALLYQQNHEKKNITIHDLIIFLVNNYSIIFSESQNLEEIIDDENFLQTMKFLNESSFLFNLNNENLSENWNQLHTEANTDVMIDITD